MSPVKFSECNSAYAAPSGFAESQIATIPAFHGEIQGGSCDGLKQVVVAYRLTKDEIACLADGGLLYLSMIGGLAPHYPSLNFHDATHPA